MTGRLPVARSTTAVLGALSPEERSRLVDEVHALWSDYFTGMSKADFVRTHLCDDTRLVLSYGRDGELASFANINPYRLEAAGRTHVVLTSGFFNRLEYQGSNRTAARCVVEVLKVMARNPGIPVAGVAVATSPVSYNWAGRNVPCFYPHPDHRPPPELPVLLEGLARARGLPIDPEVPWMVQFPVQLVGAERLERSRTLQRGSRWISWYEERAPDWREGRVIALWAPLTARNVVGVLSNLARDGIARGQGRPLRT